MWLFQTKKWGRPKEWVYRLIGREARSSALSRIETYLQENKISYRLLPHSKAFFASELAKSLHVTEDRVAKAVIVRARRSFIMAVLPAPLQVNFPRLAHLLKTNHLSLATESELKSLFPDCAVGAMPPFGNLYGLPVYVDVSLNQEPILYFAAGSDHHAIEMRYEGFNRLVKPQIGIFAAVPIERVVGF